MLTKEFLCFRKQAKALFLCLALVLAATAVFQQPQGDSEAVKVLSPAIGAAAALAVVFTINIMAYEEKTKWNLFVKSLPLSSHAIVGARYILTLCFTAAGAVFVLAAALLFWGKKASPEIWAAVWVGGWAIPLVLCAVLLPLLYKFSLQKALPFFFCLVFVLPVLAAALLWKANVTVSPASAFVLLKFSPAIVSALLAASFLLSCKIYSHKEI